MFEHRRCFAPRARAGRDRRAFKATLLAVGSALAALLATACGQPAPRAVHFHDSGVPSRLSEWGVVSRAGDRLQLGPGVVEYQLNSALFTDYAHKLRTVWMPEGVEAGAPIEPGQVFDLPVGTILSKTFYYPLDEQGQGIADRTGSGEATVPDDLHSVQLIETRLLVHRTSGWIALPYVWNESQSDAELTMVGERVELSLTGTDSDDGEFAYYVPDVNQCGGCHVTDHETRAVQPIGPKPRHLDREAPATVFAEALQRDGSSARPRGNQLQQWQQLGLLDDDFDRSSVIATADWTDEDQPLEDRVRGYLDINCSHCHSVTGPADTSGLLLTPGSGLEDLGVCKPPIAAGRGTGNRRVGIAPGEPEESILLHRMRSTDPGVAMPELGRTLSHAQGVDLIRQWIESLEGDCGTERFGRSLRQAGAAG